MRWLLVTNPTAQSGKNAARIVRARELLARREVNVEVLATEPAGRTPPLVQRRIDDASAPRVDVVVSMGGDGTFADTAKGVLAASRAVPMGMLPTGTANDQGRSFGLASGDESLGDNLDVILAGHTTRMDVGELQRLEAGRVAHEDVFFDSAGFGVQAEVLAQRNADRAIVEKIPILRDVYRDQLVYAGAVLDAYVGSFLVSAKWDARVRVDGLQLELTHILDVIVKNTAIYGGAWVLAPESAPDDGKMELVPITGRRDWLAHALVDLEGQPVHSDELAAIGVAPSRHFAGRELEIVASKEVAVQIDGEEHGRGRHFRVRVQKGLLPVITPAGFAPPWRGRSA